MASVSTIVRTLALSATLAAASCMDAQDARIQRSAAADDIQIEAPAAGARISSPLRGAGVADNVWYFEAAFPARLMARDGTVIAQALAIAASDWTREGPVPFNIEMAFTVEQETPATLVLEQDMPSEDGAPRQVRIPVVLAPGP